MKIEGSADIPTARDKVWAAFLDPTILAQALPGCEKLEAIGPNEYKATMKVGVAAIKGTFEGKVKLSDLEPPHRYRMAVEGSGGARLFLRGAGPPHSPSVPEPTGCSHPGASKRPATPHPPPPQHQQPHHALCSTSA